MSLLSRLLGRASASALVPAVRAARSIAPRAGAELSLSNPDDLEDFIRLGLVAGGSTVTAESAMRVTTVYRCVALLSESAAGVPMGVYRLDADEATRDRAHAVDRLLNVRPNAWQSPYEFRRLLMCHVILRGNAFVRIVRGVGGRITDLWPLDPDRVTVTQAADYSIVYEVSRGERGPLRLKQSDVLHLRALGSDGVTGVSLIGQAREAIGVALETERHAARMFRNGARPSGTMSIEGALSDEAYDRMQAQLAANYEGAENAGRVMVLEQGAKFSPITMTSADAQFLETRAFQRNDIATVFGIPPFLLGDTTKASAWGTGLEQIMIGFNRFTLAPWLTLFEQAMRRDLLGSDPALDVRADMRELLRGDQATRTAFHTAMLQFGVMSPNEVRREEGFSPRDGGDIYYPPPNMTTDSAEPGATPDDEEEAA